METLWRRSPSDVRGGGLRELTGSANPRQHRVQPQREQLVRFFNPTGNGNVSRFPAVGDSQRGRRRKRQVFRHWMCCAVTEDALDGLLEQVHVDVLILADKK